MSAEPPIPLALPVSPVGGSDPVGDDVAACVDPVRASGIAHETDDAVRPGAVLEVLP